MIHQPQPEYPALAKRARIQGIVQLQVVVSRTGTADKVTSLPDNHPLLAPAAVDAVQKWIWPPLLFAGNSAALTTTVSVNFTLNQ